MFSQQMMTYKVIHVMKLKNLFFLPEVVLKPRTAEEISLILKICNEDKIPVTPRGAGTGLSGGALAHLGGVLISTGKDEYHPRN